MASSDRIVDGRAGEARLAAEIDRAVRYHRPVTIALVQIPDDATAEDIAAELRPMDLLAEAPGGYLLILPELGRAHGHATIEALVRGSAYATALVPDDATTPEAAMARLREGPTSEGEARVPPTANMRGQLAEIERSAIVAALERNAGNQTRTAQQLGLSRRSLIYKMEKYGLKAAPNRGDG